MSLSYFGFVDLWVKTEEFYKLHEYRSWAKWLCFVGNFLGLLVVFANPIRFGSETITENTIKGNTSYPAAVPIISS